jgi:hypothetical protein
MKKLLYLTMLGALLSLTACEKEPKDCNCGRIVDDGITGTCYWVDIRSKCSGNVKRFCLSKGDWMNAHAGSDYCITNSTGW